MSRYSKHSIKNGELLASQLLFIPELKPTCSVAKNLLSVLNRKGKDAPYITSITNCYVELYTLVDSRYEKKILINLFLTKDHAKKGITDVRELATTSQASTFINHYCQSSHIVMPDDLVNDQWLKYFDVDQSQIKINVGGTS